MISLNEGAPQQKCDIYSKFYVWWTKSNTGYEGSFLMATLLSKTRLLQMALIFVVLASAFVYRTLDSVAQEKEKRSHPCDLSRAWCQVELDNYVVQMRLPEGDITPEQRFPLEMKISSPDLLIKESRIEGESMYMGWIPLSWDKGVDNIYKTWSQVGVCMTKHMVWAVHVQFQDIAGKTQAARFLFHVS